MGRILIVDDEPHTRRVLGLNLQQDGHEVSECAGVQAARKVLVFNQWHSPPPHAFAIEGRPRL